jgi:hypothetical protein
MRLDEVTLPADFRPPRRRPWLTPALAFAASFAVTALSIKSAVERQTPILDSMELQPFASAAALAYAWGSTDDAVALERQVLALAERQSTDATSKPSRGQPDFVELRKLDADMAKFRILTLEGAPRSELEHLCAAATVRCKPYSLEGLIEMLKKQRHVPR